jgi:hypothetical protein
VGGRHSGYSHDYGNEDGRPQLLEQEIGESLKHGVGDEEDGQGVVVVPGVHGDISRQVGDLGVADVGPVEEADEVEEAELRWFLGQYAMPG